MYKEKNKLQIPNVFFYHTLTCEILVSKMHKLVFSSQKFKKVSLYLCNVLLGTLNNN